jgi:hypothetical protein
MMEALALYADTIITALLFPFVYFLHYIGQRSINNQLADVRGNYELMYQQVSGIRDRLVILEQEFKVHDRNDSSKYITMSKALNEIHEVLSRLAPDAQFKYSL